MTTALLIIDHGSKRESANIMLEDIAAGIRQKRPGLIVEISHMELAEPTIEMGLQSCVDQGATYIIAQPYMLSPGRHATEDIPRMVDVAMKRHPAVEFEVVECLGVHSYLMEVVLERAGL